MVTSESAGGSHIALTLMFEHPQNNTAPQYSPLMPHRNQEMRHN